MLCKRNGIKANLSNVAMMELLSSYETIYGIEEVYQEVPAVDIFTFSGGVVHDQRASNRSSARSDEHTAMKATYMAAKNCLEQGTNNT
jgi:hypothetical protein